MFFTDTAEIHCLGEAGVGRSGVTIEAVIHQIRGYDFGNDDFFQTDRYLGYAELSPEPQQTAVKIDLQFERVGPDGKAKDDEPYPAGSYLCEMTLDVPCAMFANGPACTNAGVPSVVCTRFGLTASLRITAIAPVAPRSSAVTRFPPVVTPTTICASRRRRSSRDDASARMAMISLAAVMTNPV